MTHAWPSAQSSGLLKNRNHPAVPATQQEKIHTVCSPWWLAPGLPSDRELEDSRCFLGRHGGLARARASTGGLAVVTGPGEEGRGSSLALEWPGLDGAM